MPRFECHLQTPQIAEANRLSAEFHDEHSFLLSVCEYSPTEPSIGLFVPEHLSSRGIDEVGLATRKAYNDDVVVAFGIFFRRLSREPPLHKSLHDRTAKNESRHNSNSAHREAKHTGYFGYCNTRN